MKRKALLLGSPGLGLAGTATDIELMSRTLGDYDFDIDVRSGDEATRQGILSGIEDLIAGCGTGDAAVIYFTGHGSQIPNLGLVSRPVREPRRAYYQLIIPTDFQESTIDDFRGILDVELGHLIARLADKTRNTTVILDCCHAGGAVRRLTRPGVRLASKAVDERICGYYDQIYAHVRRLAATYGPALDPVSNPHVVRVTAATAEQQAREVVLGCGTAVSLLTHALAETLAESRGLPMTWDALSPSLRARVRTLHLHSLRSTIDGRQPDVDCQKPAIEGPRHRLLFSCDERPASGHVFVERQGSDFYVASGALAGLRERDELAVMPAIADAPDPAGELARAVVVEVTPERARVELRWRPGTSELAADVRAYPVRRRRGPGRGVAIRCGGQLGTALARMIASTGVLEPCYPDDGEEDFIAIIDSLDADIHTNTDATTDHVVILDLQDRPLSAPMPAGAALIEHLLRIQHAAIARSLPSGTGAHELQIPIQLTWGRVHDGELIAAAADEDKLAEGDHIYIELRHSSGKHTLHWSIFDIDVDSSITMRNVYAPTGIAVQACEPSVWGARPGDRARGMPVQWPPSAPRHIRNLRTLLIIVSDCQHDLRALETHGLHRHAACMTANVLDYAAPGGAAMRAARPAARLMRYAVRRIDLYVQASAGSL